MRSLHLLLCSILLCLFLQPAFASFSSNGVSGIFLRGDQIAVGLNYDENFRFVLFTPDGGFVDDVKFAFKTKDAKALLGFTSDGTSWFLAKEYNQEYQVLKTSACAIAAKNQSTHKHSIEGDWAVKISGEKIYLAPEEGSRGSTEWTLNTMELATGKTSKFLTIPIDPSNVSSWNVDSQGRLYLISVEPENTYLESYSPAQQLVWKQPLYEKSIEKTEIKIANIDSTGRIYLISNPDDEDSILTVYTKHGSLETKTPFSNLSEIVSRK
jgi:hypothetical protein